MDNKDFFKLGGFSVIVVALAGLTAFAGATLENGDFSDGLNGWTVDGNVTDGGGYALFEVEGNSDRLSLSQEFTLPTLALELSFDVEMSGDFTTDGSILSDTFAASLLKPDKSEPLISNPGSTEFYRWENIGGTGRLLTIATVSGNTVSLDVSGLAGQNVLLLFDLRGSDDGKLTSVSVDNVSVSVIPAPGALMLGLIGTGLVGFLHKSRIGKIS